LAYRFDNLFSQHSDIQTNTRSECATCSLAALESAINSQMADSEQQTEPQHRRLNLRALQLAASEPKNIHKQYTHTHVYKE